MTAATRAFFSERAYVVTGGTQGIGEAAAMALAKDGAKGVVISGRNAENGKRVVAALEKAGAGAALYVPADRAKPEDCRRIVAECDRRVGRVDGLVNAAGVTDRGTIADTTVELWDRIFAINARAPFLLMQAAIAVMRREGRGGAIVNIITMSSHGGQPFITAYSASKGALATLTKNVAHAVRFDASGQWHQMVGRHAGENRIKSWKPAADWLKRAKAAAVRR